MTREVMEFDVVIVGAGPAGLAAACRIMQLAQAESHELSVCVIEKGSEVGAHIMSGAVVEPRALEELFPDWKSMGAPLHTAVAGDQVVWLRNAEAAMSIPHCLVPKSMTNKGNYIASVGQLCRWLAEQAEALGVSVFPGFAASSVLYHQDGPLQGSVKGVVTGDMGLTADGEPGTNYLSGMELHAKYTLFTEGCRGHLGKQLIQRYDLDSDADPQHYGIGIKELWEVDPAIHQSGLVIHGSGWPLLGKAHEHTGGGFFLYHGDGNQVMVGLIIDLNYSNPWISPYDEFQKLKHHPLLKRHLEGGKRLAYGARAIAKGGFNSLPKMSMPGALLLGCDAGTLDFSKIKGTHTAMKSGMIGAETVFEALHAGDVGGQDLSKFADRFKASWLHEDLFRSRNFGSALHKFGTLLGGVFNTVDQNLFRGRLPFTLHDTRRDHDQLKPAEQCPRPDYSKPDGKVSFDKLSSVFLANTYHEESQPCHLRLTDPNLPIAVNLPLYDEPAQRYCPAGVYEVVSQDDGSKRFQINAQNCVHCKTCDIKDPSQNITWCVPEGGSGPNYSTM